MGALAAQRAAHSLLRVAGVFPMTDPDLKELFPENPDDLKPWHPLIGFGWDAVRLAEAHHYCGLPEVKSLQSLKDQK